MSTVDVKSQLRAAELESIEDLILLNDEEFVNSAYLAILGRKADDDGFRYYVSRIRQGFSKSQVIYQMARSDEGVEYESKLRGLKDGVRRYRLSNIPFFGFIYCLLTGHENNRRAERRFRSLENNIQRILLQNTIALHNLANVVGFVSKPLALFPAGGDGDELSSIREKKTRESNFRSELRRSPPRTKEIFFDLKSIVTNGSESVEHAHRN